MSVKHFVLTYQVDAEIFHRIKKCFHVRLGTTNELFQKGPKC